MALDYSMYVVFFCFVFLFLLFFHRVTAPPSFGTGRAQNNNNNSGWRSARASALRWRTANSQWCNSCNEGGELLCCERCPASFHLVCLLVLLQIYANHVDVSFAVIHQ